MSQRLRHSMFQQVFFPVEDKESADEQALSLRQVLRYQPKQDLAMSETDITVFDFETTGLHSGSDRIVEIGAIKYRDSKEIDSWSRLVNPGMTLSQGAARVTGISNEMLKGEPLIAEVLPKFLAFIQGSILCAHNAEFDMAFFKAACLRAGYQLFWPCFCTLKMARAILPELPSKNLDTIAAHYGLKFDSRHRSIGDCMVTGVVLDQFVYRENQQLNLWRDFEIYTVGKNEL